MASAPSNPAEPYAHLVDPDITTVGRLAEIELAGPVSRLRSNLIGGVKRLPIRFALKPAD